MPTSPSVARVDVSRVHGAVETCDCDFERGDVPDVSIDGARDDDARSRKTSSPVAVPMMHAVRVSS